MLRKMLPSEIRNEIPFRQASAEVASKLKMLVASSGFEFPNSNKIPSASAVDLSIRVDYHPLNLTAEFSFVSRPPVPVIKALKSSIENLYKPILLGDTEQTFFLRTFFVNVKLVSKAVE